MLMKKDRFKACILAGAIGDAWGSSYENEPLARSATTYYWTAPREPERVWAITDDTQLSLASCEAMQQPGVPTADALAACMLRFFRERRLTGIGASTLKALQELAVGGHWSQVGRTGEYAAGNGAAMRIAPYAFHPLCSREIVRDLCRITHRNDEAYTGALAVVLAIRAVLSGDWNGQHSLFTLLIPQLPDTNLRDRLIQINEMGSGITITDVARLGTNGYVVNSVPLALFAASRVLETGMEGMLMEIINAGGDTDTNASIAGQVAGALVGTAGIPASLLHKLKTLPDYSWIRQVVDITADTLFPA
ncbi:ADP-ribosylglycohydrolase family protein [Chitinophaga sp. HK235]|uniref:ADP-ribosylglycohydrolase family protein n=1 Tax=Chitinophaga sp. HK235 TaxID=2952571 RepID=UPI001BA7A232|nr:ADP-ribosylglycohydrolase family protein [Chitinophaga sp. HK235]